MRHVKETHRFIADGVGQDWWTTTSPHPHETYGVVRDWWKTDHTTLTRRMEWAGIGGKKITP